MTAPNRKVVWTGRVISLLASGLFVMSAFMKLQGGAELDEGMAHMGLPDSMILPLAILELSCLALYWIPATSVLGAICTHWRVGDWFLVQIALGIAIWLGLWLRETRSKALLPFRTPAS